MFNALVDLDNTLISTGEFLLNSIQVYYNVAREATYSDIVNYRIEKCIPDITTEMIEHLFYDRQFWASIPLIPGAHAFMNSLSTFCDEVHIVTDRFWYSAIDLDTKHYLDACDIKHTHLSFVDSKDKAAYVKEHNINIAFEDRIDNAFAIAEHCPVGLIAQPYNGANIFQHPIMRCETERGKANLSLATDFAEYVFGEHKRISTRKPQYDTILDLVQKVI